MNKDNPSFLSCFLRDPFLWIGVALLFHAILATATTGLAAWAIAAWLLFAAHILAYALMVLTIWMMLSPVVDTVCSAASKPNP